MTLNITPTYWPKPFNMDPVTAQDTLTWSQDGPKTSQLGAKMVQSWPKTPQIGTNLRSKLDFPTHQKH